MPPFAFLQNNIKDLFLKPEVREKRKRLEASTRRYVALKKAVTERRTGSSMCLPPEMLGNVVRFVSDKCFTRASIASTEWCDAFKLQSEAFWKSNALKRFPIIATMPGVTTLRSPPGFYKEQYRKQLKARQRYSNLIDSDTPNMDPISTLDDYTFSVELLAGFGENQRSLWVGTASAGESCSAEGVTIETEDLPKSVWSQIFEMDEMDEILDTYILGVQVTVNSTGQIAQLYRGESDDSEENIVYFSWENLMTKAADWLPEDTTNVIMRPHIICDDSEEESPLTSILIRFSWALPDDITEMSVSSVLQMLEHFIALD